MNPFDFRGPDFLWFYLSLLIAAHIVYKPLLNAWLGIKASKFDRPEGFDLANLDPYLVAYLRGTEPETARVAIVSLIDRGLLKAEGDSLWAPLDAEAKVGRPLERQILRFFEEKKKAALIFRSTSFKTACAGLREELGRRGLMPSREQGTKASTLKVIMILGLVGVSLTKIVIALGRGRHNIGFLVFLTFIAVITLAARKLAVRTEKGAFAVRELQDRFARLHDRSAEIALGGSSRELVLLTAVFGVLALPTAARVEAEALFPAQFSKNASSGSSCGTACGSSSSCGSSGGSSCGGGGGGCGGCGGGGCG